MAYLLDTGILLRLIDTQDPQHPDVTEAVSLLGDRHENLIVATQNVAEFWNVATRPIANNGLALTSAVALESLEQTIESICLFRPEPKRLYGRWKELVTKYDVIGKQVHDARLVAFMLTSTIENILTLNARDFRRYEAEGIAVVTPSDLITSE